ncbi:hypothetical protein [Enterococcus sp. DIV0756]|uniref:hypothetical protein n=1 Tax=Enterococcus sp. DIV0756 TaxID=2774636 RepID=UPI003F290F3B
MVLELMVHVVFWGFTLYSLIGLLSLLRVFTGVYQYDELEKKAVFDALSMSMVMILLINLLQLSLSFLLPSEWRGFVSPGGFYHGGLISNAPLHFDSFLFDCSIIGICYMVRRYHFGLIKSKNVILSMIVILAIIFIPFLLFQLLK